MTTERQRINKYYAKRLTKRYKARMAHIRLFKTIVYTLTVATIFITPMAIVRVTGNAIQYTWGFPEAEAREIGVIEARQTVANEIRRIGTDRGFKWLDYAVNIACEESLLGTLMENTKGNYPADSIDRAYWGINDYWHSEISDECAYDITCSTNFFMDMVEAGRQHEWCSDKKVKGIKDYSLIKCKVQ